MTSSPATSRHRYALACAAILLVALLLRVVPIGFKAPWMDEAATTIFSLGNSSYSIPMNRLVALHSFLRPLQGSSLADPGGVLTHLLGEDNHPPLYFLLAHAWFQLTQAAGGLASISLSRLLPALLGFAAVPLSIWSGRMALGRRGALLTGAWMAVSPIAVAQSLEIRHYSLAILLGAAALLCFLKAWTLDQQRKPLPWSWLLAWIAINNAGVASHYFFVFNLLMQLGTVALLLRRNRRCWLALLSSIALAALWLPLLSTYAGSRQSSWLRIDTDQPLALLSVPVQGAAGILFNAVAPGTYAVHPWQWPFTLAAGLATLLGMGLLCRLARCPGERAACSTQITRLTAVMVLCGLVVQVGISLIMLNDFTKGFRYSFFLIAPTVLLLASLCERWLSSTSQPRTTVVVALLSCGLICSTGVDAGAVLPKWYSADLLLERVARESKFPVVLAYDNNPVGVKPTVIGHEPLSMAWWIAEHPDLQARLEHNRSPLRWIMAIDGPGIPEQNRQDAQRALEGIATPIDLWVVGGQPRSFIHKGCSLVARGSEGSHSFNHFRCNGNSQA